MELRKTARVILAVPGYWKAATVDVIFTDRPPIGLLVTGPEINLVEARG